MTIETVPLKEPIGTFVIENAKGIQGRDGTYYHYSEVCVLLKRYQKLIESGKNPH